MQQRYCGLVERKKSNSFGQIEPATISTGLQRWLKQKSMKIVSLIFFVKVTGMFYVSRAIEISPKK